MDSKESEIRVLLLSYCFEADLNQCTSHKTSDENIHGDNEVTSATKIF